MNPKALLSLTIVAILTISSLTLAVQEPSEAVVVDTFSTGDFERSKVFTSAGEDTGTFAIELERDANVTHATFSVEGLDNGDGKFPENVTINLDGNGDPEYRFKGEGYGAFGHQYMFNTSAKQAAIRFDGPGDTDEASVLLPKGANVLSAQIEADGQGLVNWNDNVAPSATPSGSGSPYNVQQWNDGILSGQNAFVWCNGLGTDGSWMEYTWPSLQSIGGLGIHQFYPTGARQLKGCVQMQYWNGASYVNMGGYDAVTEGLLISGQPYYKEFPYVVTTTKFRLYNLLGHASSGTQVSNPSVSEWQIFSGNLGGPDNPALDVGNHGGTPDWQFVGELDHNVVISDFEDSLNTYLSTHAPDKTDAYGNEMVTVPLKFTADTESSIMLTNLSITYEYKATVDTKPGGSDLTKEISKILENTPPGGGNVTIPIHVSVDSPGEVRLSDLNIFYDDAPVYKPIGPQEIDEDTAVEHFLDLSPHFVDDIEWSVNLTYEVVSNTMKEHVGITVADGHWLSVDATIDENWNSEAGDGGLAEFRIRATDSDNHSVDSPPIPLEVLPVNDEPVARDEIPDLMILEGAEKDPILLSGAQFFYDVEFDYLHYSVMVDPQNAYDGEEGNVTAEYNAAVNTVEVTSQEDFHTGDGPPVPIWIFADDDSEVNDIDDGYTDGGKRNYTYQEVNVTVVNVNDAPVWEKPDNLELMEDEELVEAMDLRDFISDVDSDIDDIAFELKKNNNKKIKVTVTEEGLVSVQPAPDQSGSATVEVEADDGDDRSETTFKVTVIPVNDIPTINVISHTDGQTVFGIVDFMGTADDVEKGLTKVEVLLNPLNAEAGGTRAPAEPAEPQWMQAEGTQTWSYTWDTTARGVKNGDYEVTFRAFDGEAYSENATLHLTVANPVNERPKVSISTPADGDPFLGDVFIMGTGWDDTELVKVEISIGDNTSWVPVASGSEVKYVTWSHTINVSTYNPGNLTLFVRGFDGEKYSEEAARTIVRGHEELEEDDEPRAAEGAGSPKESLLWLWLLIAVIAIVTVVVLVLFIHSNKKKREREEEERRKKREEEREARRKAEEVDRQLQIAAAASPAGGAMYGTPGPPPPPAVAALPPPPPPAPTGYQLGGGYQPAGGYAPGVPAPPVAPADAGYQLSGGPGYGGAPEVPLLPPAPPMVVAAAPPAAAMPPPPAPPAVQAGTLPAAPPAAPPEAPPSGAPPGQVNCYNCGGMVPVPGGPRPVLITCPACGTQGEVG